MRDSGRLERFGVALRGWLIVAGVAIVLLIVLPVLAVVRAAIWVGPWALLVISAVIAITPWVILFLGPVGQDHNVFTFYWMVSPSPLWLFVRSGVFAFLAIWLVVSPTWMQTVPGQFPWFDDTETHTEAEERKAARDALAARVVGFTLSVVLIVGLFAATDVQAAHDFPSGAEQCYAVGDPGTTKTAVSGQLSKADGLYFTVGLLTTAGTGSIQPKSPKCRTLVLSQNVIGAVVILVGVAGLLTRVLQNPLFGAR